MSANQMNTNTFQADGRKRKRDRADKRFKFYGFAAIVFAISFLVFFFVDIIGKGLPAFQQAEILVNVHYSEATMKNYNRAVERKYKTLVSKTWLRLVPNQIRADASLLGHEREEERRS